MSLLLEEAAHIGHLLSLCGADLRHLGLSDRVYDVRVFFLVISMPFVVPSEDVPS